MENQKKLTILIVNHLKSQIHSGVFSEESLESVEVAIQCIESAYNLNPNESVNVETKLEKIVNDYFLKPSQSTSNMRSGVVTDASKKEAEYHKNCGNEFMKNKKNETAIEAYSKSISLNPGNPIYYCNRAAAYNAIGKYNEAINDCQKAIELDSTYCKAYCRLGLAFSYMKDYHKAATCYQKACELDPSNMGYRRNYHLTLNNLKEATDEQERLQQQSQGESASMPPNFIDTAARLMTDPDVSHVLNNILGDGNNGGLDRLMQVGQTIVTRLQTSNPNLLDGLRMQFQNAQNEGQHSPQNGFSDEDNQPN